MDITKPSPRLHQSFKKRFPFRLSVPSFVYRADYATNTRWMGPYVDEIELLLFESDDLSLPTETQIQELSALATQLDITYNVHLPLDLDLGTNKHHLVNHIIERLTLFIGQVAPLSPTTHTLHLQCNLAVPAPDQINAWQVRTIKSLENLLNRASIPSRSISVETLEYPPQWLLPIIEALDLAVCVDVGHVLRYGFDLQETLDMFAHRIDIFHMHGVSDGKDHLCLDKLDLKTQEIMRRHLSRFHGSVSLEVFYFDRLRDSLSFLMNMMVSDLREK